MTDTEIIICLTIIFIPVILMSLWCVVTISMDIDTVIKRCDSMKRWAKNNLDEREGDHNDSN